MNIDAILTAILDKGSEEYPMQIEMNRDPKGAVAVSAYPGTRRYAKATGRGTTPGIALADLTLRLGLELPDAENNCDSCGLPLDPSQPYDGHPECREQE